MRTTVLLTKLPHHESLLFSNAICKYGNEINIFLDIFPIPLKTPVKQPTSKHPTCEEGFLVFHIAMKCRQTTVTLQLIVQKMLIFGSNISLIRKCTHKDTEFSSVIVIIIASDKANYSGII